MATKRTIAEQALRIIEGGHPSEDRTLDIREIMVHLDQLRDKHIRESVEAARANGDYTIEEDYLSLMTSIAVGAYTGTLTTGVLPYRLVSLPNGMGIYQVTEDDLESPYMICKPGQISLLHGTDAVGVSSNGYVWQEGQNLIFKNVAAGTSVSVLGVVVSEDINDETDYPMPADVEAKILQQLVQMFAIEKQQPHDEMQDGIK